MEHRKLAVDLSEVVIEWEKRNSREENDKTTNAEVGFSPLFLIYVHDE